MLCIVMREGECECICAIEQTVSSRNSSSYVRIYHNIIHDCIIAGHEAMLMYAI